MLASYIVKVSREGRHRYFGLCS